MTFHRIHPVLPRAPLRRRAKIVLLYIRALLREFRWTLLALLALVTLGALLHRFAPAQQLPDNQRCSIGDSIYAGWMALLAQPQYTKCPWYLKMVYAFYPVTGFILFGEGVVRLALLMLSRRRGEKEWMLVVASTYRDHVILCGLGHLGFRVLERLVTMNAPTVVLEQSTDSPFIHEAKAMRVPVLVRDMTEDAALIDAGVEYADTIIICSNDDMANIEVALDARRMNPEIHCLMRMYDQRVASKITDALTIDAAFSASALAAPLIAAMAFQTRILATFSIGGEPYVAAEVKVEEGTALSGRTITDVENTYATRVLARSPAKDIVQSPPLAGGVVVPGDTLIVHTAADQLPRLVAAGKRER
jgi:voltage-gated potassium channel